MTIRGWDSRPPAALPRELLYYPFIELTDGPWLRHAILYWDHVASIVPDSLKENERDLSVDLLFLRDAGVYREVRPRQVFTSARRHPQDIRAFEDDVLMAMSSDEFLAQTAEEDTSVDVHHDKVAPRLIDRFIGLGLAVAGPQGDRMLMKPTAALYFMARLAKLLCNLRPSSVPGTNVQEYEDWLFPRAGEGQQQACLDVTFESVLPIPAREVALADILDFRAEHKRELRRLRRELDRISMALASTASPRERDQALSREQERVEEGVAFLKERMRVSGMRHTVSTLKAIIAVSTAVVSPPLAIANGVVTVADAAIDRREAAGVVEGSPFAYMHRAKEAGILE